MSTAKEIVNLKIDDICRDGGTQPRAAIDYTAVQDYADAMRNGAKFPPVVVFFDGVTYWLADGFHRVEAALMEGRSEIAADVRQGTQQDAQWYSLGANKTNGIRRTHSDKQRAVRAALLHEKSCGLSDSVIARHVGVDSQTVANWRHKLESSSEIRKIDTRTVNRKGRSYQQKTSNIGRKRKKRKTNEGQSRSSAPVPDQPEDEAESAPLDEPAHAGAGATAADWQARISRACGEIAACSLSPQDFAASIRRSSRSEELRKQLETTDEFIKTVLANLP